MSDANALKLVEAGVLIGALLLFVWWQLRDLNKAAAWTAREREQAAREQNPPRTPPCTPPCAASGGPPQGQP